MLRYLRSYTVIAPDLLPTEIANALAVAERAGRIQPGEAGLFFADFLKNSPILHAATPLLPWQSKSPC